MVRFFSPVSVRAKPFYGIPYKTEFSTSKLLGLYLRFIVYALLWATNSELFHLEHENLVEPRQKEEEDNYDHNHDHDNNEQEKNERIYNQTNCY